MSFWTRSRGGVQTAVPTVTAANVDRGPHVEVRGLGKAYGDSWAVQDLTLQVRQGEFFGLLGPSGCGKTTTLNMISGFIEPTVGEVVQDGRIVNDVAPHQRPSAMVFQSYALFPHLSVAENIGFGPKVRGEPRDATAALVDSLLEFIGLTHCRDRYPRQLSGGQQQRVAIARALAVRPSIILLDEPLSNLDAKLRAEMRIELRRMLAAAGVTVILVTHDQSEAFALCDRVALLFDGHLEALGTPRELYSRPQTRRAAEFIGEGNFLRATLLASDSSGRATARLMDVPDIEFPVSAPDHAVGDCGVVLIRPESISLATPSAASSPRGTVREVTYLGEVIDHTVEVGGLQLRQRQLTSHTGDFEIGQEVEVSWTDDAVFLGE